jgi:hypothetical protein
MYKSLEFLPHFFIVFSFYTAIIIIKHVNNVCMKIKLQFGSFKWRTPLNGSFCIVFRKKNIKRCDALLKIIHYCKLCFLRRESPLSIFWLRVLQEYLILCGASHHLKPFCKTQNTPAI